LLLQGAQCGALLYLSAASEGATPLAWGRAVAGVTLATAALGALSAASGASGVAGAGAGAGSVTHALERLESRLGVAAAFASAGSMGADDTNGGGASGGRRAAAALLASRLHSAVSEHDVLRAAADALLAAFPSAGAQALGTLTRNRRSVALLEVAAVDEAQRRALQAALPRRLPPPADADAHDAAPYFTHDRVSFDSAADEDAHGGTGADGDGGDDEVAGADTSVAFVCSGIGGAPSADSADWGLSGFSDWADARAKGLPAAQLLTARLCAQGACVGFLCLSFPPGAVGFASEDAAAHASLRRLCDAVADAVLARRARDAADGAARAAAAAAAAAVAAAVGGSSFDSGGSGGFERGALRRRISSGGGGGMPLADPLVSAAEVRRRARAASLRAVVPSAAPPSPGGGGFMQRTPSALSLQALAAPVAVLQVSSAAPVRSAPGSNTSEAPSLDDFCADFLPDYADCVTLIFADVAGWTALAGGMHPSEAHAALDALWQRFDTLAVGALLRFVRCLLPHLMPACHVLTRASLSPFFCNHQRTASSRLTRWWTHTAPWLASCPRAQTTAARRCGSRWTCTPQRRQWAARWRARSCASGCTREQ
jgi:hypothetical protein